MKTWWVGFPGIYPLSCGSGNMKYETWQISHRHCQDVQTCTFNSVYKAQIKSICTVSCVHVRGVFGKFRDKCDYSFIYQYFSMKRSINIYVSIFYWLNKKVLYDYTWHGNKRHHSNVQSVWAGQLGILDISFVFINVCNTQILPKYFTVYLIHYWCLLAYQLNHFLKFIGGILQTRSQASLTSSKRQHCKSALKDDNNQNFERHEVWEYCWCRIVSILLSDNTLFVIVDIYDVGLSWCRLKSLSNKGLFFLTVIIKLLQNSFSPD